MQQLPPPGLPLGRVVQHHSPAAPDTVLPHRMHGWRRTATTRWG